MGALQLLAATNPISGQLIAVIVLGCLCGAAAIADIMLAILKRKKRPGVELAVAGAAATTTVVNNYYLLSSTETATEIEDEDPEAEEETEETEIINEISSGFKIMVRYRKSFLAKLIQSTEETKSYYSDLKNALLSYKKIKSRVSWNQDSCNLGRKQLAKFTMRGKTLCIYLALNPDDYADTKFKVERAESLRFTDVPCMYRVKNERRKNYALELIDILADLNGIPQGKQQQVNYKLPYQDTQRLIERGLIKVLTSNPLEDESRTSQAPETETLPNENYQQPESKSNINEKVLEIEYEKLQQIRRDEITVTEANDLLSDETAAALVEKTGNKGQGRMDVVNVDTLSDRFLPGDTVTLEKLKEKKLISALAKRVKICARGHLDKPLIVYADEFSVEAVKMILLTGGKAIRG